MSPKSPLQIYFSRSPLCEGLSEEEIAQVYELFELQELPANTTLYAQGDPADALYVVLEGRVEISRDGARLGEVVPGSTIGEMSLFRKSPTRSATALAATPVSVLRIARAKFRESLVARDIPAMLVANLTEQIADRLR
jgi:CRP-like cAMP-binding protein